MRHERLALKTIEILLFVAGAVCMASGIAVALAG